MKADRALGGALAALLILAANIAANLAAAADKPSGKPANSTTSAIPAIKFADLPLDLAIKQVRGSGRRVFAIFEDPNCGYCKQLAAQTADMTDVTIYSFVYPILGDDSTDKARTIRCAADPARSWNDWMLNGTRPTAAKCDAGAVDRLVAIGKRLGIRGTPTIFLANGERISGAVPRMTLEMAISAPKVLAVQAEAETRLP